MCSSTCLLPVLVEEEESVQDSTTEVPTVAGSMEGRMEKHYATLICVREGENLIFLSRLVCFCSVCLRLPCI